MRNGGGVVVIENADVKRLGEMGDTLSKSVKGH